MRLTCFVGSIVVVMCSWTSVQTAADDEAATVGKSAQPAYRVVQQRPDRLLAVLPNRLIVVAQQLRTVPIVSAQVYVKTGSIYESAGGGAGLSHFLEHLVSGGTTQTRTEEQSNAILGRIGGITNASTSLDEVRYYINTTRDHAAEAVALLSDWLQHSKITTREYERERDVIQREFEMGQGEPRRLLWKLTQQARFQRHPARHPTIGYFDEFLNISRDEIYSFYKRMYVPNNMVFLVVGDIDKEKIVGQIARLWSASPAQPLPRLYFPVEPPIDQARHLAGSVDIDKPRLRLAWPGTRLAAKGDYALDLLAVILGQGESSRLVRTVRDEQRAVNTIDAYNLSFAWGEGFFGIDAAIAEIRPDPEQPALTANESIQLAKGRILDQVERLRRDGVTEQELTRAKRQVMADVIYSHQSAQALARGLAQGLIDMGDPDYMHRYAQRIQTVTGEQLSAAADRFLDPQRLITITLMPTEQGHKADWLKRPAESGATTELEPIELDNKAILERVRTAEVDPEHAVPPISTEPVRRHVLPNGLRLLVGRSTLVPAVAVQMYQAGGLLSDEPGREGLGRAIAQMRMRGTTTRSAQQIAQRIDELGASLSTSSGYNTSYTRAVCLKQDFPELMIFFADVVLNPAFREDEWKKMQPRLVAAIDRQTDSWHGELRKHFRQAYFTGHSWSYTPLGRREVVAGLIPDVLRDVYRRRVAASETVLAVFGDVEVDQVVSLVRSMFGDMPEAPEVAFAPRNPSSPTKTLLQVKTGKQLGAVEIGFGPGITRNSKDYAAISVLTRVLSRFPSGWLDQQLRGVKDGLVYVVGSNQVIGFVPGYVAIIFNAKPEKLPEALRRTAAVVERARNELVDEQTLANAKASVLTSEFLYKQSNSDRAAEAALDELYGLRLNASQSFLREVRELDPEVIRAVARTYLRNPVTVVLSYEPLPEDELQDAIKGLEPN